MTDDYDSLFKLVIVGDQSVGKTSLMRRYVDKEFSQQYKCTIGVDFKTFTINTVINGVTRRVKLQIWDTGGQERFSAITHAYYRGAHGGMVVFALNDAASFVGVTKWMDRLDEHNVGMRLLIGAKSDLAEKMVSAETISTYCEEHGVQYVETSSLAGINVIQAFETIATQMTELLMQGKLQNAPEKPPLVLPTSNVGDETVVRKGCCGGNG